LLEKYELPSYPIKNGLRSKDGKVAIAPQRGPWGLLEWVVLKASTEKGRAFLVKAHGMSPSDNRSVLRVLSLFVGGKSVEDLSIPLRTLSKKAVEGIFKANLERGYELLVASFQFHPDDIAKMKEAPVMDWKAFMAAWLKAHVSYTEYRNKQIQVQQEKEKAKSTEQTLSATGDDLPMDDPPGEDSMIMADGGDDN